MKLIGIFMLLLQFMMTLTTQDVSEIQRGDYREVIESFETKNFPQRKIETPSYLKVLGMHGKWITAKINTTEEPFWMLKDDLINKTKKYSGLINIEFEDNETWEWGMFENFEQDIPWNIRIALMEDGQAREKGVKEGWKVKSINSQEITRENHKNFDSTFREQTACTMTFEKTELNNLHKALIDDKSAEEIKEIMQEWRNTKGKDWLTKKIIEEIEIIKWICQIDIHKSRFQIKDIKIFETLLNFLEDKPKELREYIKHHESMFYHSILYDNDSIAHLELLINTLENQGENIEDYLCSADFPFVLAFKNEEFIDYVIQKISPKKLINRVFNDPKNLLKEFAEDKPIAFKKLVKIALEIGEQNALIEKIESESAATMTINWFGGKDEEVHKIIIEKIYEGKEDKLTKYLQEDSCAITHAFIFKNLSAIKLYTNTFKKFDEKNGTKILINALTKKTGPGYSPLIISSWYPNLLQLIENTIPHETFKEILFDPEQGFSNYMLHLIVRNNLDFLTKWFKIAEKDQTSKNNLLKVLSPPDGKDYLHISIENELNEMAIMILNFYENAYGNENTCDENFGKILTEDKLIMSLKQKQLDVSLKLMQNMTRLNCKLNVTPFENEEISIYETLHSMIYKTLSEHDMQMGKQLTVNDIQYFLDDKQKKKLAQKMTAEIGKEWYKQPNLKALEEFLLSGNYKLENFQILMKAIVDHAKGPMALIKTIDFIQKRFKKNKKNGPYDFKI